MAYFGKEFVMQSQENFDAFLDSLKLDIPADVRSTFANFKPTTKIVQNGDEYTITSTRFDGSTTTTTFRNGVQYEETNFGRTAQVTVTVDGDTFTQVQTYPEGTVTYTRTFTPNELVVTITQSNWDGQAKRFYRAN